MWPPGLWLPSGVGGRWPLPTTATLLAGPRAWLLSIPSILQGLQERVVSCFCSLMCVCVCCVLYACIRIHLVFVAELTGDVPSKTVALKGSRRKVATTDHGNVTCGSKSLAAQHTVNPPRPVGESGELLSLSLLCVYVYAVCYMPA